MFFFQAEDGIRDLVRSRGLGDVYKRQKLYLAQQKPAEGEKEARQALRLNPSSLEAAVVYGDTLVLGKNWTKAEEVYGAIVRQLPGQPIGYVKMAALRKLQARPAEAVQLFSQALSRAPDDLIVLQDYLVSLVESKQAQQADRVLDQYLTKAPRDPNLWRLAGRMYVSCLLYQSDAGDERASVDLRGQPYI